MAAGGAVARANSEYDVDHHGDRFYLRINDTGRNFRLVSVPLLVSCPSNSQEIVPHRTDVMLEDVDLFQDTGAARVQLVRLVITDPKTGDTHCIAFDEPAYSSRVRTTGNGRRTPSAMYYESMTTPDTVYDYNMATREHILRKRRPVLGDFNSANYVTERRTAGAPDGTEIPVSLVYRKGRKLDGSAPLWLEGYGAYGHPNDVCFSSKRLSA